MMPQLSRKTLENNERLLSIAMDIAAANPYRSSKYRILVGNPVHSTNNELNHIMLKVERLTSVGVDCFEVLPYIMKMYRLNAQDLKNIKE